MTAASRPPDDTPTRLPNMLALRDAFGVVQRVYLADEVEAEVSRLREALNEKEELLKQIMRTVHVGTFQAAPVAVEGLSESVSRLQQENALLKRSLEMLTKQMAETPTVNEDGF